MYSVTRCNICGNSASTTPKRRSADTRIVKPQNTTSWSGPIWQHGWLLAMLCLSQFAAPTAFGGIKVCKLSDGTVVFQDTECAVIPKTAENTSATGPKTIPFGIEKSWFDEPPVMPARAACNDSGCQCGDNRRKFDSGIAMALADALYLDGSWHRLEATLAEMARSSFNHPEIDDLSRQRDEAACNILMSQLTLRMFGEQTLAQLRAKKRYAEDRGLDNPDDCDAGDISICEYTDNIALYHRLLSDIKALATMARVEGGNYTDKNQMAEQDQ